MTEESTSPPLVFDHFGIVPAVPLPEAEPQPETQNTVRALLEEFQTFVSTWSAVVGFDAGAVPLPATIAKAPGNPATFAVFQDWVRT